MKKTKDKNEIKENIPPVIEQWIAGNEEAPMIHD